MLGSGIFFFLSKVWAVARGDAGLGAESAGPVADPSTACSAAALARRAVCSPKFVGKGASGPPRFLGQVLDFHIFHPVSLFTFVNRQRVGL